MKNQEKIDFLKLGIDIGSTTVKIAFLDQSNNIYYSAYERHYANIQETLHKLLSTSFQKLGDVTIYPMITGSGGLSLSKYLEIPFIQEVIAVSTSLQTLA